jgi:hypothetical protein
MVLHADIVDREVEVADGAFEGGVEAAGEDLGGERDVNPWQGKCLGLFRTPMSGTFGV